MRKSTTPSKPRTESLFPDLFSGDTSFLEHETPWEDSSADWNEESPAPATRKHRGIKPAKSETTALLDRESEIRLAETLHHAKQELLNALLLSRTAVHWLTETDTRKSGLDLDKAAQLGLRRLLEKGDLHFAEIQAEASPSAKEALSATVQEIRGLLAHRKFQVARMDALFETLNRCKIRLHQLGNQISTGDTSGLGEMKSLERQLWIQKAELDGFFARIKKWETLFLETRSALVVANLRLVPFCANRLGKARMAFEDLAQEGYAALTVAVENYQAHVSKFSTFATKVIHSAMIRAIDDQGNLIRIPVHACEKLRKIHKQAETLRKTLGRDATDMEIAAACNLSIQKVQELRAAAQTPVSLDTPFEVLGAPDPESLFALQASQDFAGAAHEDTPEKLSTLVHQRLGRLSPEEREVVERIYGLGNFEVCSEKEVARALNRTETKIRAILNRALKVMANTEETADASTLRPEDEMLGIAA